MKINVKALGQIIGTKYDFLFFFKLITTKSVIISNRIGDVMVSVIASRCGRLWVRGPIESNQKL